MMRFGDLYKFEYTIYENHKNDFFDILSLLPNVSEEDATIADIQTIINVCNDKFRSNLELTNLDFDLVNHNSTEMESIYLNKGYLKAEYEILIRDFHFDLDNYGFNTAISNLELSILELEPNEQKFSEYNLFVNSLMLMNELYSNNPNARIHWGWGCGVAIASNALASYALVACVVPNPATPGACAVAVVGKALALAGVFLGCNPN